MIRIVPYYYYSFVNSKGLPPYSMKGNIITVKPFFVRAEWDEEASVWVATSDNVPGLATEETTHGGLDRKAEGHHS